MAASAAGSAGWPVSGTADCITALFCLTRAPRVNVRKLRHSSRARARCEVQIAGVQRGDLIAHGAHIGIVMDHVIRRLDSRRTRSLRLENGVYLLGCRTVPVAQAADLQLLVTVDYQHPIHVGGEIL